MHTASSEFGMARRKSPFGRLAHMNAWRTSLNGHEDPRHLLAQVMLVIGSFLLLALLVGLAASILLRLAP